MKIEKQESKMHFYLSTFLLLSTVCLGLIFDNLYRNALRLKPDLFEGECPQTLS